MQEEKRTFEEPAELIARIGSLQEALNLNQRELCEKLGITPQYLRRVLQGKQKLSRKKLRRLADVEAEVEKSTEAAIYPERDPGRQMVARDGGEMVCRLPEGCDIEARLAAVEEGMGGIQRDMGMIKDALTALLADRVRRGAEGDGADDGQRQDLKAG